MKIVVRDTPRLSDERVLEWMRRRNNGESCGRIAADYGVSANYIRDKTNCIKQADMTHSGFWVERFYW